MKFELIIRDGMVVTPQGVFDWDIAVSGGKIVGVADRVPGKEETKLGSDADRIIDAAGLHIFPGLIDAHCHFDEPGYANREGIYTGSCSVAASGVTTYLDHPISNIPPMVNAEALEAKREASARNAVVDYGIVGGVTPDNLQDMEGMHSWGAVAFKAFMSKSAIEYVDDMALLRAIDQVAQLDSVILLHAENQAICTLLAEKNAAAGRTTLADFVASRPILSETESVRRAAAFAEITGGRVQICHASSGESVEIVKEAKARGVRITVETCPHYLSLSVQDMPRLGGCTCSPPMREQRCIEDLWEAIKAGDVDTIGSDHSSWPITEDTFGGLSGGQSTLPVLLTEGYHRRGVSLERIAQITSANPAKLYRLDTRKGGVAVGFDADLAIVDLGEEFVLTRDMLFDKQKHSPYLGKQFKGAVKYTISRGDVVFEGGRITAEPGRGRMVTPWYK